MKYRNVCLEMSFFVTQRGNLRVECILYSLIKNSFKMRARGETRGLVLKKVLDRKIWTTRRVLQLWEQINFSSLV